MAGDQVVAPTEADEGTDDADEDAHGLLRLLLDARGEEPGPAILLLSATPYRPPAGGVDGAGLRHYEQFFRLLEFLYGAQAKTEVPALRSQFRRYGTLLREAVPGNAEVLCLRDDIQSRLFRVIARTERAGLLGRETQRYRTGATLGRTSLRRCARLSAPVGFSERRRPRCGDAVLELNSLSAPDDGPALSTPEACGARATRKSECEAVGASSRVRFAATKISRHRIPGCAL